MIIKKFNYYNYCPVIIGCAAFTFLLTILVISSGSFRKNVRDIAPKANSLRHYSQMMTKSNEACLFQGAEFSLSKHGHVNIRTTFYILLSLYWGLVLPDSP